MALAYWTDAQMFAQLNLGKPWTTSVITYAIPTVSTGLVDSVAHDDDGFWYRFSEGFRRMSVAQSNEAIRSLKTWDDLIAADFQNVSSDSQIEIAYSDQMPWGILGSTARVPIGSIWLNYDYSYMQRPTLGSEGWAAFIHEYGHAIGLNHSGPYNGAGSHVPASLQDSTLYSIMSYFEPGDGGTEDAEWFGYDPQTPMMHDVIAIQRIYGAETTTRTGNDVYGFNSVISGDSSTKKIFDFSTNLHPILTIWDSAGNDTLDLSGYSKNSFIDIGDRHYSSTNGMTKNIWIASKCNIENAIGGGGNDKIVGNELANKLYGNALNDAIYSSLGNDYLNGGTGNDRLVGGVGRDIVVGGSGTDSAYVEDAFSTASVQYSRAGAYFVVGREADRFYGIERFDFSDGISKTFQEMMGLAELIA